MISIKRTISADSALNHLGQLKEFVDSIYCMRAVKNINFIKVRLHQIKLISAHDKPWYDIPTPNDSQIMI